MYKNKYKLFILYLYDAVDHVQGATKCAHWGVVLVLAGKQQWLQLRLLQQLKQRNGFICKVQPSHVPCLNHVPYDCASFTMQASSSGCS
jgi:hypothetical protein